MFPSYNVCFQIVQNSELIVKIQDSSCHVQRQRQQFIGKFIGAPFDTTDAYSADARCTIGYQRQQHLVFDGL